MPNTIELSRACKPALHGIRIHKAGLLKVQCAASEHGKVRNALHVIPRGKLRMLFGIDLEHHRAPGQIPSYFGNMRSSGSARAAPRRPEVHKHRHLALAHDLIELRRTNRNWL
jgi:hypothetical protein